MRDREPPNLGPQHGEPGDLPRVVRRDGHAPLQPVALHPIRTGPPRDQRARRPAPAFRDDKPGRSGWLIALLVLFGLAGALAGLALVAAFLFNPGDLVRERLIAEVKARTGRDLAFTQAGAMRLFPDASVSFSGVSLSAVPGMPGPALITLERLDVAVSAWPLLTRRVVIDRLEFVRPVIDLRIDGAGRRSWDFAANALAWPAARYAAAGPGDASLPKELRDFASGASPDRPGRALAGQLADLSLRHVTLRQGTIRYSDERSGIREEVSAADLTLRLSSLASPLEVAGTASWRGTGIALDLSAGPLRAILAEQPANVRLVAKSGTLAATYDGTLTPGVQPGLDGTLGLATPSLSALAESLGLVIAAEPALGALDLTGRLRTSAGHYALADAKLTLGAETMTGALALDTGGIRPAIKGNLRFAELDLDRIERLAGAIRTSAAAPRPAGATPVQPARAPNSIEDLLANPAAPTRASPQVRGFTQRSGWSDERISLASLTTADADIRIAFSRLLWRQVKTGAGQAQAIVKDGAGRLAVDDLALYGGRARGVVTLDGAGGATLGANVIADGVDLRPLLSDAAAFDGLAGRGRISFAIAGRGQTERELIATLNGKADLNAGAGAVIGYDVTAMLAGLRQGKFPSFDRNPQSKTDFSELAASFVIASGVMQNKDLRLAGPQLNATGAGTINLPERTLDYLVRPSIAGGAGAGAASLELPLRVQGPWDKPKIAIDGQVVLRNPGQVIDAVRDLARTEQGRNVQETVKGALQGDPAAQAKARDMLRQLLPR